MNPNTLKIVLVLWVIATGLLIVWNRGAGER